MSNNTEKTEYLQKAEAEIIKLAAEAGARAALEAFEREKKNIVQANKDWRLRNTKLLLRRYRLIKIHCEGAIYGSAQARVKDDDFASLMEECKMTDKVFIESIKRSAERTALIMSHVDEMLKLYEIYCVNSRKPEEIRRFDVVFGLYISEIPLTADELARRNNVVERTVYKDIDAAAEKLSVLFFGIDGVSA